MTLVYIYEGHLINEENFLQGKNLFLFFIFFILQTLNCFELAKLF